MARKPTMKEIFASLDNADSVTDRYSARLQELDELSCACIRSLVDTSNQAVDFADTAWKDGATPNVLQETDSTVIHIRRAREAVDNLPTLCSRLR